MLKDKRVSVGVRLNRDTREIVRLNKLKPRTIAGPIRTELPNALWRAIRSKTGKIPDSRIKLSVRKKPSAWRNFYKDLPYFIGIGGLIAVVIKFRKHQRQEQI